MALPDISSLRINGSGTTYPTEGHVPQDILDTCGDRYMEKLKNYAESLPYSIEPYSKMTELLDFILLRITQCVEAKDYDVGLLQWDSMLN